MTNGDNLISEEKTKFRHYLITQVSLSLNRPWLFLARLQKSKFSSELYLEEKYKLVSEWEEC